MKGSPAWQNVSANAPCPICRKPDWCRITPDGRAVSCMRNRSRTPLRNGGWLHRINGRILASSRAWQAPARRAIPQVRLAQLAREWAAAITPQQLSDIASALAVSSDTLQRLGLGWDGEAWTFPMIDARGLVCGVRRRLRSGRKLSVAGGREGIFAPIFGHDETPMNSQKFEVSSARMLQMLRGRTRRLLVCEGPTDCAALLDLGFSAIGRPSCSGGQAIVANIVRGQDVVIVADSDQPGQLGAERLARTLRSSCPRVRIISPPDGIKDAREWAISGATIQDIESAIQAANPVARFSVQAIAAMRGAK